MDEEPDGAREGKDRWSAWRARRRLRAEEARARREATRVKTCEAPRCWGRSLPGEDYCGLHQRL